MTIQRLDIKWGGGRELIFITYSVLRMLHITFLLRIQVFLRTLEGLGFFYLHFLSEEIASYRA